MAKVIFHLFGNDKKQHQKVRAELMSASSELVSIKPANEIRVEDVTEYAQVSRGTFYQCFRSVDDLLNVSAKQAGRELTSPIVVACSTIVDMPLRLAAKTRMGIRLTTGIPLLGRLMLKSEWPFTDLEHKGYQDIQKDVALGIAQGCFTDMPLEIGVNIVITTLRGAVQEMLDSPQPPDYEDHVIYHLLLSLGVNAATAQQISQIPLEQLPNLPKKGVVGKILKLVA
jgi:AcrR family transcriptional regulator